MRALSALMMLLGALAVLMTAAAPARAMAEASSPPPCHEAQSRQADLDVSSPHSGTAMKAIDCCVAWVVAPGVRSPEPARMSSPRPATAAPLAALPPGERPAPEPYPPRPAFL